VNCIAVTCKGKASPSVAPSTEATCTGKMVPGCVSIIVIGSVVPVGDKT
jgi:hypothetical protein